MTRDLDMTDAVYTVRREADEEWRRYVETHAKAPVTVGLLGGLLENITHAIRALRDDVKALQDRPPTPEFKGVFEEGVLYPRGGLATKAGSLWLATWDTTSTPGNGPASGWVLIVKNGAYREGR